MEFITIYVLFEVSRAHLSCIVGALKPWIAPGHVVILFLMPYWCFFWQSQSIAVLPLRLSSVYVEIPMSTTLDAEDFPVFNSINNWRLTQDDADAEVNVLNKKP